MERMKWSCVSSFSSLAINVGYVLADFTGIKYWLVPLLYMFLYCVITRVIELEKNKLRRRCQRTRDPADRSAFNRTADKLRYEVQAF